MILQRVFIYAFCLLLFSCGEEPEPNIPSLKDTHWVVRVKWQDSPDSITVFLYLNNDGTGTEEDISYLPLENPVTWTQNERSAGWRYTLIDVFYNGNLSEDGRTMTGDCIYDFPIYEDMKGKWSASRR